MGGSAWSAGLGGLLDHLLRLGGWFGLVLGLEVLATGFDATAIDALAHRGASRVVAASVIASRAVGGLTLAVVLRAAGCDVTLVTLAAIVSASVVFGGGAALRPARATA